MKSQTKKCLSLLMAAALLVLTVLPAFAQSDYSCGCVIDYTVDDTGGEPALRDLDIFYYWGARDAYLPKSVGGVTLTTDNLTGANLTCYAAAYRVDEDNAYFSAREGMLYSKDGKTLVHCPEQYIYGWCSPDDPFYYYDNGGILVVPDGTLRLGEQSVFALTGVCVVLPDSVTELDEDCGISKYAAIAATPGGPAESWALAHGVAFVPMGKTHTHAWFRLVNEANCSYGGRKVLQCPCGEIAYEETTPADPSAHCVLNFATGNNDERVRTCIFCGREEKELSASADCSCNCHRMERRLSRLASGSPADFLRDLLFRIRLLFWQLTGTHQYCECGARHY